MNVRVLILLFSALVIGLSSCKKGNGDVLVTLKKTNLNVINAGNDTLNFYENGTRLNNTSNLYPFGSLGYTPVDYGTQNFQFKKAVSPNTLVSFPLTLDTTKYYNYTLFVAGETADKIFLLRDTLITDTIGARVRFVNASSAGNVDVYIGTNISLKNVAFKSATGFLRVKAGIDSLIIYPSGSNKRLAAGIITVLLNNSYTLFTKGALNGTGNNAFGARIITQ
ncbi:MAG: hypothetical protein JWQ79_599 [Mucilaginibacter sp.]|nr:hypothetical protein [Mucilaginibacter sp.]